jgi:hypothetical protein
MESCLPPPIDFDDRVGEPRSIAKTRPVGASPDCIDRLVLKQQNGFLSFIKTPFEAVLLQLKGAAVRNPAEPLNFHNGLII